MTEDMSQVSKGLNKRNMAFSESLQQLREAPSKFQMAVNKTLKVLGNAPTKALNDVLNELNEALHKLDKLLVH